GAPGPLLRRDHVLPRRRAPHDARTRPPAAAVPERADPARAPGHGDPQSPLAARWDGELRARPDPRAAGAPGHALLPPPDRGLRRGPAGLPEPRARRPPAQAAGGR